MQDLLLVCIINHATDPNSGIASAYSFWVFKLALVLSGVRIAQSSCVVFGRLLFVHLFCFLLAIVLSVNLRFSATRYPFGISKLILCRWLLVCFVCFEFVPFSVAHFIVWFMDSDYLFGIFKLSKWASICIRVAYFFLHVLINQTFITPAYWDYYYLSLKHRQTLKL